MAKKQPKKNTPKPAKKQVAPVRRQIISTKTSAAKAEPEKPMKAAVAELVQALKPVKKVAPKKSVSTVARIKTKTGRYVYRNKKTGLFTSEKKYHAAVKRAKTLNQKSGRVQYDYEQKVIRNTQKYRYKGRIVNPNIHKVAIITCELLQQKGLKCSYQYIIEKFFDLVEHFMKNNQEVETSDVVKIAARIVQEQINKRKVKPVNKDKEIAAAIIDYYSEQGILPKALTKRDHVIADFLGFKSQYDVGWRQNVTREAHELWENGQAKGFYVRPLIIKKDHAEVFLFLQRKNQRVVHIGEYLHSALYLAGYFAMYNSYPEDLEKYQKLLTKFIEYDFGRGVFRLKYAQNKIEFNLPSKSIEIAKQKDLAPEDFAIEPDSGDWDIYLRSFMEGELVKLPHSQYMSVLDYHLSTIWRADERYKELVDEQTIAFLIWYMTESLTKTFCVDFHNTKVSAANSDMAMCIVVGEFITETHTGRAWLDQYTRLKIGAPDVPDEE